ncbi:hypothetical protein DKX38_029253 [Salix brachista]|uniref:5-methyltetrahydropteroyltriglutamate--homocysteine S-methyltransferase n=1 Tax=Salix brachista TaxID=2182728 RepID=A0A5N5J3K5_9ROSI|nr:hypothetical protein DKX38_029253 [Salix brachista]
MVSHIVVYPRMGPKRELKLAQESFWDGKSSAGDLQEVAADLSVEYCIVAKSYASHKAVTEYKDAKAGVTAFGFLVRGTKTLDLIKRDFPEGIDGRNNWSSDLAASLETLEGIVGKDKLDTNVSARLDAQQKKLNLPVLPTTTIGPFPQTMEPRKVRLEYKAKRVSEDDSVKAIKEETRKVVKLQEEFDIDGPKFFLVSMFREGVKYGAGIGPGVYDIHSPRVPSTEEIADGINKMLAVLETIQVNPDCGQPRRLSMIPAC